MRIAGAVGWVVLAFAVVVAMAALLPLQPNFLEETLDGSFAAVLHHGAAHGLRLISTYGPLGFAYYDTYLPETWTALLAVRAALAAALCWGAAWLGGAAWRSPWGAALALFACAPLLRGSDARWFVLVALVPLVELVPGRAPPASLRLALGAVLGLLALIKVSFVTAAVVVLAPTTVATVLARGVPLTALAAAASAAIGWALLGLSGAELVAYLDWSLREIMPGYTEAMQLRTAPTLVGGAAVISGALLAWAGVLAWRTRRRWWWATAIAFAMVLLVQFKAGFTRADVHVFTTVFALLMEGVLLALLGGRHPAAFAVGVLLVAALPGTLLWSALALHGAPTTVFRFLSPADVLARLRALPSVARGDAFTMAHEQRVRDLRGVMAMPALEGGVDMIAHRQSLLIANRSPYRPRPVFQGYMAYTPRLAAANAAFLASDGAPHWLLFDPETIDGRLPTMDDAELWPLLLGSYRSAGVAGRYALLERRDTPRRWRLVPIGAVDARTGEAIPVPPAERGPIWARIEVQETLVERLRAAVFAGPYVFADLVFVTNAVWRARLVPAIARDGFLLSPVVSTVPAFVALSEQGPAGIPDQAVREIRVRVDSPFGTPLAPRPVRIELSRLELE